MAPKAGIEIRADLKMLRKELADATNEIRTFNKNVLSSATSLKPLEDAGKRTGGVFKAFSGFFGSFTKQILGAQVITRAAGWFRDWGRSIIQSSSSLTELQSKAKVVFGDSFPAIEQGAKAIADEVGRASSTILQFATDMGAVIKAFGLTGPVMENMSTQLAKLAVDMASFHNTADEDAFMALRSGLTGETEPLKRFGIVLTDTNLKMFALTKGITKNVEQMNQAEKTALRYAFIMEKTADAQGDAARTADTFANQTRRLQGEWKELNEELGKEVTPALASGLSVLNDFFTGVFIPTLRIVKTEVGSLLELLGMGGWVGKAIQGIKDRWSIVTGKAFAIQGSQRDLSLEDVQGANSLGLNRPMNATEARDFQLRQAMEEAAKAGAGLGAGGGKGQDRADLEKKVVDAMGEQAKLALEQLNTRRDDLLLRKELGILMKSEEKELAKINRRLEFKDELIEDATEAWKEQLREVERVEERIKDITQAIADEREKLADRLAAIDKDANESAIEAASDFIKERNDILAKSKGSSGLTGDMSRRLGEIDDELRGFTPDQISQATELAGMSAGERKKREQEQKIQDAKDEANARISALEVERTEQQRLLAEVQAAEQMKKQAVVDSLNERLVAETTHYKTLEEAAKAHADEMVKQFNRIYSAQRRSNASGVKLASGGPVVGAGGPTSDSIPAWLSNGEYVINAAATKMYRPLIEKINSMTLAVPRFATGGPVNTTNTNNQTINVNQQNYGEAARFAPDPHMLRWNLRKFA